MVSQTKSTKRFCWGRYPGTTSWQRFGFAPVLSQSTSCQDTESSWGIGVGWGQRLQAGMALGSDLDTGFAAKGRQDAQTGCLEGAASGESGRCASHLIGLNHGREEAPNGGEDLLGPPFQQQGDLGWDRASEPSVDLVGSTPPAWGP